MYLETILMSTQKKFNDCDIQCDNRKRDTPNLEICRFCEMIDIYPLWYFKNQKCVECGYKNKCSHRGDTNCRGWWPRLTR